MPIDISKLSKKDIGRWVRYSSSPKDEAGRIKSWNDIFVFVVYNCDEDDEDWDNYQNYTAAATKPEDLTLF